MHYIRYNFSAASITFCTLQTEILKLPSLFSSLQMVGMVIGAGIAIVLIAILIFFILRRIQLRSQ